MGLPGCSQDSSQVCSVCSGLGQLRKAREELEEAGGAQRWGT